MAGCGRRRVIAYSARGSFCSTDVNLTVRFALRRPVFPGGDVLRLVELVKNPPTGLDIDFARICEREAPARSVEEPRVQMCLEFGHSPADSREWRPEFA